MDRRQIQDLISDGDSDPGWDVAAQLPEYPERKVLNGKVGVVLG
jgi:hypothetical protein